MFICFQELASFSWWRSHISEAFFLFFWSVASLLLFFPCYVNNGAVSRFLLLNLILRIFFCMFFLMNDDGFQFSKCSPMIFQSCWSWCSSTVHLLLKGLHLVDCGGPLCLLLYKDFILLFEGLLHFSFFHVPSIRVQ